MIAQFSDEEIIPDLNISLTEGFTVSMYVCILYWFLGYLLWEESSGIKWKRRQKEGGQN